MFTCKTETISYSSSGTSSATKNSLLLIEVQLHPSQTLGRSRESRQKYSENSWALQPQQVEYLA